MRGKRVTHGLFGLSALEVLALKLLSRDSYDGIPSSTLYDMICAEAAEAGRKYKDCGNAARQAIHRLKAKGLVERRRAHAGGVFIIKLTREGRKFLLELAGVEG